MNNDTVEMEGEVEYFIIPKNELVEGAAVINYCNSHAHYLRN